MSGDRMRVLLIGNVNNAPLDIALGLRACGVNAQLVVTQRAALHNPSSTRWQWRWRRPRWIHDLSRFDEMDYFAHSADLRAAIAHIAGDADFAILNEMAPSLAGDLRCGHAFMNTGSDLTFYGDERLPEWRSADWDPDFRDGPDGRAQLADVAGFVRHQREGIAAARFALTSPRGAHPAADRMFDALGFEDARRHMWRIADVAGITGTPVPEEGPLVVSSMARVDFRPTPGGTELDLKGTDILIRGVALAIGGGTDVRLELPIKGGDVSAARALVEDLGIADRVTWIGDVPRHQYLRRLRDSVIVADSLGASGPATVTHDALASGRPVLGDLQPDIWGTVFGEPYPGLHAGSPDDVAAQLDWAARDRRGLAVLGERGRAFAERHLSLADNSRRIAGRIEREA